MTGPQLYSRYHTVPASLLLKTLGDSLDAIKREDEATDTDLGAALGKHAATAERYRKGNGKMDVVSFLRGCRQWDGRFANAALGLIGMKLCPIEAEPADDQASVTIMLRLTVQLSAELERDNDISDADLERHRSLIERVGRLVDSYRHRLRIRAIESG